MNYWFSSFSYCFVPFVKSAYQMPHVVFLLLLLAKSPVTCVFYSGHHFMLGTSLHGSHLTLSLWRSSRNNPEGVIGLSLGTPALDSTTYRGREGRWATWRRDKRYENYILFPICWHLWSPLASVSFFIMGWMLVVRNFNLKKKYWTMYLILCLTLYN